jgi:hypothetical protein
VAATLQHSGTDRLIGLSRRMSIPTNSNARFLKFPEAVFVN